jgi:ring-1,2-phenylacetyl-CoA epoxidase subunit PaaA
MYGGGNTFEGIKTDSVAQEDPILLAAFEARIERGEKIAAALSQAAHPYD